MKFSKSCATILILILGIKETIAEVEVTEILALFGDKNCIAGSLGSPINDNKMQEIKKDDLVTDMSFGNFDGEKSTLSHINELAQYNDISYSYELIREEGPSHSKTFTIALHLGDETYTSDGKSLKKAQKSAANFAIKNTQYRHPPVKFKEEKTATPTLILNNLAAKLGLAVEYSLVTDDLLAKLNNQKIPDDQSNLKKSYIAKLNETALSNDTVRFRKDGGDAKGPFTMKVDVNRALFYGESHSIQNAKHEAAFKALQALKEDKSAFSCLNEDDNCKLRKNQLKKSPISLVYEAAEKRNLQVNFEILDEMGPSHNKLFTIKCSVGDLEATGQGKSKKEAKKSAAENILPELLLKAANNLPKVPKNPSKKKKKKKIIKNSLDKIDRFIDNVMDFVSGNSENKKPPKDDKKSPTNELLEVGKVLNLQIKFQNFDNINNKATFYSVVELGLQSPSIICLGEGVNEKNAKDLASKYALNALFKLGFLDKFLEKSKSLENGVFEKEEEIQKVWLNVVENKEKDEL